MSLSPRSDLSGRATQLAEADKCLSQAMDSDPDFLPAQYYKSIVLTHERKADAAIQLLEGLLKKESSFPDRGSL